VLGGTGIVGGAKHAALLWKPIKAYTFFQERRHVRCFIVREREQEQGQS
jgi:hypothetical protein